jgi:hypothetical protein
MLHVLQLQNLAHGKNLNVLMWIVGFHQNLLKR